MARTGGCYCGQIRFEIAGEIPMRGLCYCRSCQILSGGMGNLFIGLSAENFHYTRGKPARFRRSDRPDAPEREFCGTCGTPIAGRSPKAPTGVIVRSGALDNPASIGGPDFVTWAEEKLPYHCIPENVRAFDKFPTR